MQNYITRGRLQVAEQLDDFINQQAMPGTGVQPDAFWQGAEALFSEFVPQNLALLEKREQLQLAIDTYHKAGNPAFGEQYREKGVEREGRRKVRSEERKEEKGVKKRE